MRLYTCVCVYVCVFVHRLWVSVLVLQRVDGVMHAHVCSCAYVCVCIWVWVYIYVHLFAVSVACTLEQVSWTLVHGQVCTIHRCVRYTGVFLRQLDGWRTHLRTHSLQVVHICVYLYICVYACICIWMRVCVYDIA